MTFIEFLCKVIPYKEIGWKDIGETFYRFTLAKTPWFNVYLHALDAPRVHPEAHDHPWNFWTLILKNGYIESGQDCRVWTWRGPGTILYRQATHIHNVTTNGVSWSIVLTGPRIREWGFRSCT